MFEHAGRGREQQQEEGVQRITRKCTESGIFMVFLGYFLWYFYGIFMVFLWYFYGIFMVFLWYFYGILEYFYGIFMVRGRDPKPCLTYSFTKKTTTQFMQVIKFPFIGFFVQTQQ